MRRLIASKLPIVRIVLVVAVSLLSPLSSSSGQEAKFKGRLPPYYSDIVTESQRQEIYDLQEKYAKQIAVLEDQLEALKNKREAEIEKVLNAEQKAKLKKAQADGAAKRKKTAEKKATDAKATAK